MEPMTPADPPSLTLRQRAEAQLACLPDQALDIVSGEESERLVHELRVHQIELELQNEELRRAQEALELSHARYFALYDLAPVGYVTLSETGLIQEVNLAAASLLETPRSVLDDQPLTRFILPEDQDVFYRCRCQLWSTGEPQSCTLRLRPTRDASRWIQLKTNLELYAEPHQRLWRATLSDITETKAVEARLRDAEAQLQRMVAIAELSFWEWNPGTNAMYFPPEWCRETGYGADERPQSFDAWAALVHPEDRERLLGRLADFVTDHGAPDEIHYRLRHRDGQYRWFAARFEAILDSDGRLDRVLNVHQDITQRKTSEERALQLAQRDPLTGLPFRALLDQLANHMLASAQRAGTQLAVLFLDLDHFKAVNDTHGHAVGDQLLRAVAARLREAFRAEDLVARLGGDEFIAVLADIGNSEGAAHAACVAITSLSRPYRIGSLDLRSTPSIGISLYPTDGVTIGDLVQQADLAMYHAKQISPGQYQFVSKALNQQARLTQVLEQRLREAWQGHQFQIVYQPILDLQRGEVVGAETLLRWPQPDGSEMTPLRWLPIADAIGVSPPLSQWVLENVCRQHQVWRDAGLPPLRIGVNVSMRQFRDSYFVPHLAATLKRASLDPNLLSLSLSEKTLLQDIPSARVTLSALQALGVSVALDDFGMGCSSLSEFDELPLDRLEINRQLVERLDTELRMPAIVETIVRLGQALQIEVSAVGIETQRQLSFFRNIGCNQGQGFLLGRPMTGEAFGGWYRDHASMPT